MKTRPVVIREKKNGGIAIVCKEVSKSKVEAYYKLWKEYGYNVRMVEMTTEEIHKLSK